MVSAVVCRGVGRCIKTMEAHVSVASGLMSEEFVKRSKGITAPDTAFEEAKASFVVRTPGGGVAKVQAM